MEKLNKSTSEQLEKEILVVLVYAMNWSIRKQKTFKTNGNISSQFCQISNIENSFNFFLFINFSVILDFKKFPQNSLYDLGIRKKFIVSVARCHHPFFYCSLKIRPCTNRSPLTVALYPWHLKKKHISFFRPYSNSPRFSEEFTQIKKTIYFLSLIRQTLNEHKSSFPHLEPDNFLTSLMYGPLCEFLMNI